MDSSDWKSVEDLFHRVGASLQQYHRVLTAGFNDVKTDLREYPFMAEVLATRRGPAIQARLARFPADSERVLYKDITPANVVVSPSRRIYFVDVQFSTDEHCDEGRLPWDHFGAEIWEVSKE